MPAPTGTVTIVFTDIQGSTELWERLGDSFRATLELHNRIVRDELAAHDGHEVKTEGDAFMAAFADAASAVRFAIGLQKSLHAAEWAEELTALGPASPSPDGAFKGLRVRVGMHTGRPIVEQLSGSVDYFGPAVNRAARVAAAAHGGQVLLSASTFETAGELDGCSYVDLGEHRLKGLDQPERIRQVLPSELVAREFPAISTVSRASTNLPAQLTSFIGRADEISSLAKLLSAPDTRLATLLAPGGTGKTRLSLRVGEELLPEFKGGVWFVDLTEARDADAVAQAVAQALGVPLTTREDPVVAVGRLLQMRRPLLLILDNFEQVVDASAATVGRWLTEAPLVTCLATSRFLLGIAGEREFELQPLSAPPRIEGTRQPTEKIVARMSAYDSVQLFVDRALQVQPGFALSRDVANDVASICAALEGLPLAIELAAARVRVMKPAKILQNLGKRFSLLKSSRRDLTDRQRTLEGAIQWSYELLKGSERDVLHQCAVFHGGFSLEAAEEVLDAGDELAIDAVQSLRDKSFLRSFEAGDELRFGMLESVREFLAIRQPVDAATIQRHAAWFSARAAELQETLEGPKAAEGFAWLQTEAENIEAALSADPGLGDLALTYNELLRLRGPYARRVPVLQAAIAAAESSALNTALSRAYQDLGRMNEAEATAERGLQRAEDSPDRVNAMCRVATILQVRGHYGDALLQLDSALQLAGEDTGRAFVLSCRGPVLRRLGRNEEAEQEFVEALKIEETRQNAVGVARNLANLGNLYRDLGREVEALDCYERAEEAHASLDNRAGIAMCLGNAGLVKLAQGDVDAAADDFARAEGMWRDLGTPQFVGINLGNRGIALQRKARVEEALDCFLQAESMLREAGATVQAANNAMNAAAKLNDLRRYDEALQKASAVCVEFDSLNLRESPGWLLAMEVRVEAEAALGRKDRSRVLAREALEQAARTGLDGRKSDKNITRSIQRIRDLDS